MLEWVVAWNVATLRDSAFLMHPGSASLGGRSGNTHTTSTDKAWPQIALSTQSHLTTMVIRIVERPDIKNSRQCTYTDDFGGCGGADGCVPHRH